MGRKVTQVLQGRFRTNDGPTVFLKIETAIGTAIGTTVDVGQIAIFDSVGHFIVTK